MRLPCTPAQIPTIQKYEQKHARQNLNLARACFRFFYRKVITVMQGLWDAYTTLIKGGALLFITYALFVTPLALELADHWRMGGVIVALLIPMIWAAFCKGE